MAATKRSLNKCVDCKYTWYPKGKDLSARCPECGSVNVKYAGIGILGQLGMGAAIIVVLYIFSGNEKSPAQSTLDGNAAGEQLFPSGSATVDAPPVGGVDPVNNLPLNPGQYGTPNGSKKSLGALNVAPPVSQQKISNSVEKIYSEDEINEMEIAKQYQGDDPIVRRRLQLPSRETGKLIP